MLKPVLRRFTFVALALVALPIGLLAQAAVEYALQSGSSLIARLAGSEIAGCNVGKTLLVCLSHDYPRTAILVVSVLCLFIVRWLAGVVTYRAR